MHIFCATGHEFTQHLILIVINVRNLSISSSLVSCSWISNVLAWLAYPTKPTKPPLGGADCQLIYNINGKAFALSILHARPKAFRTDSSVYISEAQRGQTAPTHECPSTLR
jgi:hypothetical protein